MSEVTRNAVTIANIESFIGKTVDSKRKFFHYYPLTFKKINGEYYYTDRNGVMMPFHDKDAIQFDSVVENTAEKNEKNGGTTMNLGKNAGYDITEKLTVGNSIFVLGRMDSQYGTKYVTWAARQDDPTNYFWGHYIGTYEDAREDLFERALNESQNLNPNYHKRQAEKLPDICMSILPSDGSLIILTHKESGYKTTDISMPDAADNRCLAEYINKLLGVTPAQEAAMLAGARHGWNVPAANPTNYDENGKAIKQKSRDDAR